MEPLAFSSEIQWDSHQSETFLEAESHKNTKHDSGLLLKYNVDVKQEIQALTTDKVVIGEKHF